MKGRHIAAQVVCCAIIAGLFIIESRSPFISLAGAYLLLSMAKRWGIFA